MNLRLNSRLVSGGVIVLFGLLLLLGTTETYDTAQLWLFVPSVFVLLGVWAIVQSRAANLVGPVVLILVAGTIQLAALDVLTDAIVEAYWPVLVVLVGLTVVFGRQLRTRAVESDAEALDVFAMFGGVTKRATGPTFAQADVTTLFGGSELDLRDTEPVGTAQVDVFALFGGVEIHVPETWTVRMEVLPVFGAAEDERPRVIRDGEDVTSRRARSDDVDLIVTGLVGFGGVEVN
ncbi:LiaF transmembrane domain-containing protein [Haloarchaeobius sp. DT45]|uniref:LiaF transmembrane domain-containing protein n=1 Tax=Haloarchaeobius sp. DT45 TaxID=3446116 RepID=UPI003F6B790C